MAGKDTTVFFSFFENYWQYAKTQTDGNRLAFFDSICAYVFDDREPDAASSVMAVFDLIRPSLDIGKRIIKKQEAGRRGGRNGRGVSRNAGNKNARKTKAENAENASANQNGNNSTTIAQNKTEKEYEKEREYEKEEGGACAPLPRPDSDTDFAHVSDPDFAQDDAIDSASGFAPKQNAKAPTLDAVLAWARDAIRKPDGKAIPDEFARNWFALMESAEPPWTTTRGQAIAHDWKRRLIYAWQQEQRFNAKAGNGGETRKAGTNQQAGTVHFEREANYENPLG